MMQGGRGLSQSLRLKKNPVIELPLIEILELDADVSCDVVENEDEAS